MITQAADTHTYLTKRTRGLQAKRNPAGYIVSLAGILETLNGLYAKTEGTIGGNANER